MHRSEITIDLGAVRHNAGRLLEALDGSELWAVVKANGYGHGATDVARAALEAGATALCVATVAEGVELRRDQSGARILVMGPAEDVREAREAGLEITVLRGGEVPHLSCRHSQARENACDAALLAGLTVQRKRPLVVLFGARQIALFK